MMPSKRGAEYDRTNKLVKKLSINLKMGEKVEEALNLIIKIQTPYSILKRHNIRNCLFLYRKDPETAELANKVKDYIDGLRKIKNDFIHSVKEAKLEESRLKAEAAQKCDPVAEKTEPVFKCPFPPKKSRFEAADAQKCDPVAEKTEPVFKCPFPPKKSRFEAADAQKCDPVAEKIEPVFKCPFPPKKIVSNVVVNKPKLDNDEHAVKISKPLERLTLSIVDPKKASNVLNSSRKRSNDDDALPVVPQKKSEMTEGEKRRAAVNSTRSAKVPGQFATLEEKRRAMMRGLNARLSGKDDCREEAENAKKSVDPYELMKIKALQSHGKLLNR